MLKKLLLFDLDWTLLYTGGAGIRALNSVFHEMFGVPESMKGLHVDGKTDPSICREMIKVHLQRDAKDGEIAAMCDGYLRFLAKEVAASPGYKILPGIPALLDALSQRSDVLMGLGTGNLEGGARIKLERAGFLRYFRFGGYGSDAEVRADVLRKGVERGEAIAGRRFAPRDVVVIGDNVRDVQAGKAIGATTVAVASGPMSVEELQATGPDYCFQDLSETDKVIEVLTAHVPAV